MHHVSFQPRTLREADALSAAGHDVRVVCRHTDSVLTNYDHELMRTRQWKLQPVELQRNGNSHRLWLVEASRARTFQRLFRLGVRSEGVAVGSYVRGFRAALAIASAEPADWFIAHTQAALPIAAAAARRWKARLGFDCEDLVSELGDDSPEVVKMIERRYLPGCEYISAPSTSMAARLSEQYGVRPPLVLYNVFPLELAAGISAPSQRPARRALRLHWFGQTIGPGRGLEEAIEALRNFRDEVELHLRGRVTDAYRSHLESRAVSDSTEPRAGRPCHVVFHELVKHDEVIKSMEQFDVGLSLERADHGNYALTITNKLFSYLLAGLAVAATDTPGNREILSQIPSAGFLYQAGQPESLAQGVQRWLSDRVELRQAQQAAWDAARSQFCWDLEKEKFLGLLN
jgi:glycosyltransferase involved in cell wall biosynthesis